MKAELKKVARENTLSPQVRKSLWEPFSFMEPFFLDRDLLSDWLPKVDVSENEKELTLKVNVPGVKPENITLEVDENSLTIKGATESEKEEEGRTWYRRECECGSFSRTFALPSDAKTEAITAKNKNGSLVITVPKAKSTVKKQIPIE